MKLIVQRVSQASVKINNKIVGKINTGLVVLLGVHETDERKNADILANKLINLRIMSDHNKKMNLSINNTKGEVLVVSQFTLYADTRGRRPGFSKAASPKKAKQIYDFFIKNLKDKGIKTECGAFGAYMKVSLTNDGPVTIILEA